MSASEPRTSPFYAGRDWYLFVSTDSARLTDKARNIALQMNLTAVGAGKDETPGRVKRPLWLEVLNNVNGLTPERVDVNKGLNEIEEAHSPVSAVYLLNGVYTIQADFWGINTHYWFHDKDMFVSSNNALAVARMADARLSRHGVYEALFFNTPLSCTWFDGVNCLRGSERLSYEPARHSVSISSSRIYERLMSLPEKPVLESIGSYFESARDSLSDSDCYISLSAGSDSRTVLACMRNYGLRVRATSFGCADYREMALVKEFARRYGVPWALVNVEGFEDDWIQLMKRGISETSGLLNASRLHYYPLYDSIPEGAPVFEGILASEFVKVTISVGSMIGVCHHAVMVGGKSVEEALKGVYPELPEDFLRAAVEYLEDKFSELWRPIETEDGRLGFIDYALENIPSKVFSGVIQVGQKRHPMFFPFLSPAVISSYFNSGKGLPFYNSLRSDFDVLRCVLPECELVREMDGEIYRSVLDRHMSYKEVERCPRRLLNFKRRCRRLRDLIKYRNYRWHQIDNSRLNALKRRKVMDTRQDVDVLPVEIREESSFKLMDLLLNLHYLEEAVKEAGTSS